MKFIRRIACLLLAAVLLLGIAPLASAAVVSGTVEDSSIRWKLDRSTGVLTITGNGKMPDTGSTYPWYTYRSEIKKAVIGDGVTTIGPFAFYSCDAMTEVTIPQSVKEIHDLAFGGCSALPSVKLPSGLTYLEGYSFSGCSALTSIDIPGTVTTIARYPFQGCKNLKTVILHEGLESIGQYAFVGLPITSITIPSTVQSIGQSAFENCNSLSSVRFQEGLQDLQYRSFCSTQLRTVTLPTSLKSISEDAFVFTDLEKVIVLSKKCAFVGTFPGTTFGNALVYAYLGSTTHNLWLNNASFTFQPIYFKDVQPDAWFYTAVRYAKENALFEGVSKSLFAPQEAMTRAMAVTVLWRYASQLLQPAQTSDHGEPTDPSPIAETEPGATVTFDDVEDGAWYREAVVWAAQNGIVNGTGHGKFSPNQPLSRQQLVTILYRFAQWIGDDVSSNGSLEGFSDAASVSSYAQNAMAWAVENGIITGIRSGGKMLLSPFGTANRAEVATIMMRYIENVRAVSHPQLYVYAEEKDMDVLTAAADAYSAEHPELTIHVCNATFRDFCRNYLLEGKRDLFLASNSNYEDAMYSYYVADHSTITIAEKRLHFAVAAGDPEEIGSVQNVLALLRAKTICLGVASGSDVITQDYAQSALQSCGCTYSEVSNLPYQVYDSSAQVAAAIADGSLSAGVCWASDIEEYGLTALEDVHFSTEASFVETLFFAFLPKSTSGSNHAHLFAEWMAAHSSMFTN